MRLILHTAAYWLMWKVRQAMPVTAALKNADFATICARLVKAAARVVETASRISIALASACPRRRALPRACHYASRRQPLSRAAVSATEPSTETPSLAKPRRNRRHGATRSLQADTLRLNPRQTQTALLVNKTG